MELYEFEEVEEEEASRATGAKHTRENTQPDANRTSARGENRLNVDPNSSHASEESRKVIPQHRPCLSPGLPFESERRQNKKALSSVVALGVEGNHEDDDGDDAER